MNFPVPRMYYCPACAQTPASGLTWCLEKLFGPSQPNCGAPSCFPGNLGHILASGLSSPLGNCSRWHHDSSSVPKPPYASGLQDSVLAPCPWARTTLHIFTGCQPFSPAHLSSWCGEPSTWSSKNLQAWCSLLCLPCLVPSILFPSSSVSPLDGFRSEQPVFFLHSPWHHPTPRNRNCSWLPPSLPLGPGRAFALTAISTTPLPFLAPSPVCCIRKPSLAASQTDLSINPFYLASLHLSSVNLSSALAVTLHPQTHVSGSYGADSHGVGARRGAGTWAGMGPCQQRWACLPQHTRVPACTRQHLHVPAHVPAARSRGELLFSPRAWALSAQHGCRLGFGLFGLTVTR